MRLPVLAAFALVSIASLQAQTVPTGFVVDTLVSSGLTAPNDFCFLPDGRILIANRPGQVSLYVNGTVTTVGTVPNVEVGSERALLSIAADPNFSTNGNIYVWYSSSIDLFMHLDRFTCTGDIAVPTGTNVTFAGTSRRVILANVPDNAFNHNGGSTRFGPDGMLYQSIGDDASSTCQQQNLVAQQGVILRMDVSALPAGGSTTPPTFAQIGPASNPLAANTDFSRLLIAHGLRNPVRFTIDPSTNNLYIGDVGQNAHEEYDEYAYAAGALQLANYGWPWREGAAAAPSTYWASCGVQPTVRGPLVDIPQTGGWLSVMGGPRYRNRGGQYDFGASYEGKAFYSDYFAGQLRVLQNVSGTWSPNPAVAGQPNANDWATGLVGLVSYDVGPDGALYMLQHPTTYPTVGGFLKRVRPLGPVDEVLFVSGMGQTGPAAEPFAQPIVVQVNDPQHNPKPGTQVNFTVTGSATLSTTNPVVTDSNGQVNTTVLAGPLGGLITITASTPGGLPTGSSTTVFARRINVIRATNLIVITVTNTTTAVPTQVPMIVAISAPGVVPLQTPFGPICTNPFDASTFIIEDSIGLYGFASMSGTGAIGTPGLSKIYTLAPGQLVGAAAQFQAVGFDPVTGWWRTNCEPKTL